MFAFCFEEINFEFKSPGTPQKNVLIEPKFATLYFWMISTMVNLELHKKPQDSTVAQKRGNHD